MEKQSQSEKVRIDSMRFAKEYQRDLDEQRAEDYAANFKWSLFREPVLSLRADGFHYVIDGQHEVTAAKLAGMGDCEVRAKVLRNLTIEQEAELFLELNEKRKAVSAYERHKARVTSGDTAALELERIVKSAKMKISKCPSRNVVACVNTLSSAHRRNQNLPETLQALRTWSESLQGDYHAYDTNLVKYTSCFLAQYKDQEVDPVLLGKKLASFGSPSEVLAKLRRDHRHAAGTETKQETASLLLYQAYCTRNPKKLVRIV